MPAALTLNRDNRVFLVGTLWPALWLKVSAGLGGRCGFLGEDSRDAKREQTEVKARHSQGNYVPWQRSHGD